MQSSVKGPGVQGGVFPKLSAGYYTPARPELGLVFSGSLRGQDGNRGQPILTASCAPVARRSPPGQCPSEERAREQMRKKENGLQVSERNSTQRELSRVFSPTLFSPSLLQGPGQTRLTYFREGGRWRAGRAENRRSAYLPSPSCSMEPPPPRPSSPQLTTPSGPLRATSTSPDPPDPRFIHCTSRAERPPPGSPPTSQVRVRGEPVWRVTSPVGLEVTSRDLAGEERRGGTGITE